VIHWQETAEILSRLSAVSSEDGRAALATVVRIAGSAYRRPGAKFLVEEGGETLGSVSGGCLEADVREVARKVLATGRPRRLGYDTGADGDDLWGLGLGCDGRVEIWVQPATEGPLAEAASRLADLLEGDAPVALATLLEGPAPGVLVTAAGAPEVSAAGAGFTGPEIDPVFERHVASRARRLLGERVSAVEEVDGRAVFFESLTPPRHLLVFGAGDDARPLARYAADAGFRVTVVDHRAALVTPERFPRAFATLVARGDDAGREMDDTPFPHGALAVVMTHSLVHDRGWVRRLLDEGVPYVGVLGPRGRTRDLLEELGAGGDPRVFGPVGLDLGADGPRQVALSIVSELLAFASGRTPRHLSLRREAIHAS
jgi:xanthine dehydrogenase accessory factor